MGKTNIPMSRRRPLPDGSIGFAPHPDGLICDALPVCLLKDHSDRPVACLFSIAAHPSNFITNDITADYPGVAADRIDRYLGTECSIFLQGCAGDAKIAAMGHGRERWKRNDWEMVEQTGQELARAVATLIEAGLRPVETTLQAELLETHWSLMPPPERTGLEELAAGFDPSLPACEQDLKQLWARRQLQLLARGKQLRTHASVLVQGIQLSRDLRLIAIEGEPVAEHGLNVLNYYRDGLTFPLGYANGEALYLPVTPMLEKGGYEVDSYWEYSYPSRLAPGMERIVTDALDSLTARGIT